MRIPWLIVGALVGAMLMRTWPGQDKRGFLFEMACCIGPGLLIGLAIDIYVTRRRKG